MVSLQKTKNILQDYYEEKQKIELRIKKVLQNNSSVSSANIVMQPPKLSTEARAAKRREGFELRMRSLYGEDWNSSQNRKQ